MAESDEDRAARMGIARQARHYMSVKMSMNEPVTDQHQNWIWGHMVDFAASVANAGVDDDGGDDNGRE